MSTAPPVPRVLVALFCYNEGQKLEWTLRRFPEHPPYDLLIMDDGSTDGSPQRAARRPSIRTLSHPSNRGAGASIRTVMQFALQNGYDILVHIAGNNKDEPNEIPRLLQPIQEEGFDYVYGSRYLPGGAYGRMPLHRLLGTKYIHPFLFSLLSRRRVTDSTNGFRAYRTAILKDPRLHLEQAWLDRYELEPYFLHQVIRLGYRVREVPVTKIYPPAGVEYTKMRPFVDWWSILRPIFYLWLGVKK